MHILKNIKDKFLSSRYELSKWNTGEYDDQFHKDMYRHRDLIDGLQLTIDKELITTISGSGGKKENFEKFKYYLDNFNASLTYNHRVGAVSAISYMFSSNNEYIKNYLEHIKKYIIENNDVIIESLLRSVNQDITRFSFSEIFVSFLDDNRELTDFRMQLFDIFESDILITTECKKAFSF